MGRTLVVIIVGVVSSVSGAGFERPYAFHSELETVHERGIRNLSLKPTEDEYSFTDGVIVSVGESPFLHRVATDFVEYLDVSQDVSARVSARYPPNGSGVVVSMDFSLPVCGYSVDVTADGVRVGAGSERAAAQALYHLEDLMNLREAPFLPKGREHRVSRFSPRMIHSGWAIDTFPEPYLRRAVHYGFDAILIFVPEVGRTKRAWDDINAIIRRAKAWGVDTYLYSYVHAPVHPNDPQAPKVFRDTFGAIARAYPEARGFVFVGESCQFPSKDPRTNGLVFGQKPPEGDKRPYPCFFPCSDFPDWLNGVKSAINSVSPNAEIIFWTYNFGRCPAEQRLPLLRRIPKDVSLLVTYEMYEESVKRNGMRSRTWDYSLSDSGPGGYYLSEAVESGKLGLRLYTMSNTAGQTWDLGTVPFLPCPFQWKKRWDGLVDSKKRHGLAGLMESHHYGWYPSFVTELAKEAFTEGGMPFEAHLRRIAARDFGPTNVTSAVEAWRRLSFAIEDAFPCPQNLCGPYRIGPAYPFNIGGARIDENAVPLPKASPYEGNYAWTRFNFTDEFSAPRMWPVDKKDWDCEQMALEVELLGEMVKKANAAGDAFARMVDRGMNARRAKKAQRAADLAYYMACCWTTAKNLKSGVLAMLAGDKKRILEFARDEYRNKTVALSLVARNSRLGWEPSMDYSGGKEMIEWSMMVMEKTYGRQNLVGSNNAK